VPEPTVLAQPDIELREPSHNSEDQVSGSDIVLGTHNLRGTGQVDQGHQLDRQIGRCRAGLAGNAVRHLLAVCGTGAGR
jgi:hypothetical protein